MRLLSLLLICPLLLGGQVSLNDDFSDGNLSNPTWVGDTNYFIVNARHELQIDDSLAASRYLSTPSSIADSAIWELSLRLDFNPSGSNYASIHFISDRADVKMPHRGYFLRIGGSSDDRISLFRQDGQQQKLLLQSDADWVDLSPVQLRLKVERNGSLFRLWADTGQVNNFKLIGNVNDSTYRGSSHFALQCHYTKTRAQLFYFDDIQASGKAFEDTIPPHLEQLEIPRPDQILLYFSEPLDSSSARNPSNYKLSSGEQPNQADFDSSSSSRILLHFSTALTINSWDSLSIRQVQDHFGNSLNQGKRFLNFRAEKAQLVFNEVMADPTPVVGLPPQALPEHEFIEIYNRSTITIPTDELILHIGKKEYPLGSGFLDPAGYTILAHPRALSSLPDSIAKWPVTLEDEALSNREDQLEIWWRDTLIDALSYSDDWYHSPEKQEGGWTLERIDRDQNCAAEKNWVASIHPMGGTPGFVNSVKGNLIDSLSPYLISYGVVNDSTLELRLNETVYGLHSGSFSLEPPLPVKSLKGNKNPRLTLAEPMQISQFYHLSLRDSAMDCAGHLLEMDSLIVGIPELPNPGELLINEILFNPSSSGTDFVELYNHSDKIIDLSKLRLGKLDEAGLQPVELDLLSTESRLLMPRSYLALTEDPVLILAEYPQAKAGHIITAPLPSLPDQEGSLVLSNSNLQELERLRYSEEWHSKILSSAEGVSLERINFEEETQRPSNWYSAAESSGFATPGYANSQHFRTEARQKMDLSWKVFSPNMDGYRDMLHISFDFDQPGTLLSLSVWNSDGRLVKKLSSRQLMGSEDRLSWDGSDEKGLIMRPGIYVLVAEIFHPEGRSETIRESCVLSL